MPRVKKLPDHVINRIAAGEAVERPASVAKELIENALDAGASRIEISVEGGGRRAIRVADDGCGMDRDDARLSLERHATSKIAVPEDLGAIQTLGFRGEALAAIASVSRFRMITAPDEGHGFCLELEGGTLRREAPEAHPRGTTVEVRELFYNTPARAKFLRTEATELGRISEIVQGQALARPDVRFRLIHDGRELLAASPAPDTKERVRQVFGEALTEGLLPLSWGSAPLQVSGYVSSPATSRASRSLQFLFVNRRQVQDRLLSHALREACRPYFPRDRYAAIFFFLELPPAEVDVNAHPTKREVRFRTPGAIHAITRKAVDAALGAAPPVQAIAGPGGATGTSDRNWAVAEAAGDYLTTRDRRDAGSGWSRPGAPDGERRSAVLVALPGTGASRRVVGQFRDTYIVVEEAENLLLVDQHAAHERLLYDRYREQMRVGEVPVQSLLFPVPVEVDASIVVRLQGLLEKVSALGFAVEAFGRGSLLVRAVPALMAGVDPTRLLLDLADEDAESKAGSATDFPHRVAALSACHASVRAGMRLPPERQQRIVEDLLSGGHPMTCPHGRPTLLRYPLREIERAFLRP